MAVKEKEIKTKRRKVKKVEPEVKEEFLAKIETKEYKVVSDFNANINEKSITGKEGDVIKLNRVEAFALSTYIEE
jgi:hypothetical protein